MEQRNEYNQYSSGCQAANGSQFPTTEPSNPTLKSCLADFDEQLARLQSCAGAAGRIADFIAGRHPNVRGRRMPRQIPATSVNSRTAFGLWLA